MSTHIDEAYQNQSNNTKTSAICNILLYLSFVLCISGENRPDTFHNEYFEKLSAEKKSPLKLILSKKISLTGMRSFISEGIGEEAYSIDVLDDGFSASITVDYSNLGFVPRYGGIYLRFTNCLDISEYEKITFEICSNDSGIHKLYFECKPLRCKWMHESRPIPLTNTFQDFTVSIASFEYPKTAKRLEEFTWVISPCCFTDAQSLKGSLCIRDLTFQ